MKTVINFSKKYWAVYFWVFIIWSYADTKTYQIKVTQEDGLVHRMHLTEPRWMYWVHFRTCDFLPPWDLKTEEDAKVLQSWIEQKNPSLEEIEALEFTNAKNVVE